MHLGLEWGQGDICSNRYSLLREAFLSHLNQILVISPCDILYFSSLSHFFSLALITNMLCTFLFILFNLVGLLHQDISSLCLFYSLIHAHWLEDGLPCTEDSKWRIPLALAREHAELRSGVFLCSESSSRTESDALLRRISQVGHFGHFQQLRPCPPWQVRNCRENSLALKESHIMTYPSQVISI